jgi:putative methyltransferase (TIGR01177 family)
LMDSVEVYVRPAKDHFELNLQEAKTLSELFGAPRIQVSEHEATFTLPVDRALRVLERLCGSKEAGVRLGHFRRSELNLGLEYASKIIGPKTYKVVAQPWDTRLIVEAAQSIGPRVNLRSPDVLVKLTEHHGVYGLNLEAATARTRLSSLQPKKWVYFHPGALQPFFCGLMCNLARCPDGGLVLDPFCGAGSTLVAASELGLPVVGVDLSKKQVYGCRRNMVALGLRGSWGLARADAAQLPLRACVADAAVFDPPYGKVSSLFGRSFRELLGRVGECLWSTLKSEAHVCFFAPQGAGGLDEFASRGFKLAYEYRIHVHRRLTRLLLVFRRVA